MNAIGQPISRIGGRLKVTGGARCTADILLPEATHGAIVHSTIANGRTVSIDTAAAEKATGVLAVFTHYNMPHMKPDATGATSIRTGRAICRFRTTRSITPASRLHWWSLRRSIRRPMPGR